LAGCFSSHVNNVDYLLEKPSLNSKDIRFILNSVAVAQRKRYDYDKLETMYLQYLKSDIDDTDTIKSLCNIMSDKNILVVAPGKSVNVEKETIQLFIKRHKPIVVSINFLPDTFSFDYVYFSNQHRYDFWKYDARLKKTKKIITSNIHMTEKSDFTISFLRLVKSGWNNLDNSLIMLLRLLNILSVKSIALAGFDGLFADGDSYYSKDFEIETNQKEYLRKNAEIEEMFLNFLQNKKIKDVFFITRSKFEKTVGVSVIDFQKGEM